MQLPMNLQGIVRANSLNVGSALVAGPFEFGKRPADQRRPYTLVHRSG